VFVYSGGNVTGTHKTHNTRKPVQLTILRYYHYSNYST
jgi:hypothetical protein